MPDILNWSVHKCGTCGQIFKRDGMLTKHHKKLGHKGIKRYTVSLTRSLDLTIREGEAIESFETL